jgi:sarcosine/dimethylglycine N-methyltransferase
VPLENARFDVVISQEALLHVPDKARALGEAFRLLVPGGRIAFTDWVAHRPLSAEDKALMWQGMAVTDLFALEEYAALVEAAGFVMDSVEDLTRDWAVILMERLAMYRRLRAEAERAGTPAGHNAFYASYVRLVDLVSEGALGGGRFVGRKLR